MTHNARRQTKTDSNRAPWVYSGDLKPHLSFRLRWVKKTHIFINEHLHKTFYNNNFSEHFSCKMIQLQTSCQLEIWIVRRTDWSKVLLIIMIESLLLRLDHEFVFHLGLLLKSGSSLCVHCRSVLRQPGICPV